MAIFKVTAVPDFSQLRGEIARLQGSPVTLGVDTRQANVNIKATTKEIKNVGKAVKETSGFADLMGKSFSRLTLQMATWQMLGNAIAGVKRSFVEALDTMKSVDDEMVTIRKVTGASADELEKIEKQAYKTASAYGVAADEYLQFVSGFSRAGYGEQASALAELAAKTQIVGDTNAETAQQFLLSVDAAYKYQGNIEKLTAVLDGANEIDNRYATSIQKVAEGLGKVAPIAAQAHVGVDELTAAIGTITAVTQRSGTEAATALRALFLNIIGDTKTEIDDGVTWTTGEIAGLRDVIKVYAKDAYDAAQATGSVINPMKAIAGLSKSMKDGLLTEQQLMEMVSDIGGKLRTSQLLALIQNWDMYESMLTDFAGAAGSADKEVENALDSWTRKTEILKNKWTEFVSHLVETDTIKGALDGVIKLVELLDTDVGRFVITVAALTAGVNLLGKAGKFLFDAKLIKNGKAFVGVLADAASGAGSFGDALALLNPKILIVVAAVAALYGAYKLVANYVEKANRTLAYFDEEIGGVNSQLESNKKRIEEINNMPWAERTSAILEEKAALEKENAELEKKLKLLDKEKTERAREIVKETVFTGEMVTVSHKGTTSGSMSTTFEKTVAGEKAYEFLTEQLNEYSAALEKNGEIADGVREQYEKDIAASARMVEALKQMQDAGDELTDEQLRLIAAYDSFTSASDKAQNAIKNHVSKLVEEARQSGATGKALYDLVAAQIAASNQGLNFSQQIAALQELGYQAGLTAEQVRAATGSVGNSTQDARNRERTIRGLMETEGLTRAQAEAKVYANMQHALWTGISQNGGWGGSPYSPAGGAAGNSNQRALDDGRKRAARATIDAIKKQRDAEKAAIDEKIDALRKQNREQDRSAKLEELKLDILKKQDALLNARNERTVRQYNAATGQWEWVADPEKVKKAQEDLENAKKDLREYEADVEMEIAIEELEARKKAIDEAYQIKIDGWQDFIDALEGNVASEAALLAASLGDWDAYYQEMLKVYQSLIDAAVDYQKKANAIQRGTGGNSAKKPLTQTEKDKLHKEWELEHGKKPTTPTKPTSMGGGSRFNTNVIQKYDSGGILKGMGGIKATERDEMILPPDITERMTRLSGTGDVNLLFGAMRSVLFGSGRQMGGGVAGVNSTDRHDITTNNYTVNGVPISPQMAKLPVGEIIAELTGAAHQMRPFSNG
nr:MAG TPA: minor tail protein [Caudoviricetes sp.]